MAVNIKDNCIETDLYDKRRDFNFDIVQFPDLGCIPSKPAYGLVVSQLVRFYKICATDSAFVKNTALLLSNLLTKGFQLNPLMNKVKKFLVQTTPLKYETSTTALLCNIHKALPSDFSVADQP